jgi:hypothetical protein
MLGYQLLISKTSSQGASYTQTIVIFTLEESEEVLNKHRRQGRVYDKVTSTCDGWGSAGNTGKAQQQSSLCRETAELRLIIPVLKPITPAIAFQKLDHHSPAARRAEKEEREREREREHEHERRRLRRLIIDNETPQKKRFFVTAAETEETQILNRGSKIFSHA